MIVAHKTMPESLYFAFGTLNTDQQNTLWQTFKKLLPEEVASFAVEQRNTATLIKTYNQLMELSESELSFRLGRLTPNEVQETWQVLGNIGKKLIPIQYLSQK